MKKIITGWILIFILSCTVAAAQQPVPALHIGDKLPAIEVRKIVNSRDTVLQLANLKGKAIIIDFWGEYCGPCIKALFKLDSLQRLFAGKLEIITVGDFTTKEAFDGVKQRFMSKRRMELPVVLSPTVLKDYFPYKLISHLVWISPDGVVKAFTESDDATAANIQALIDGTEIKAPMKIDAMDFDIRQPLLGYQANSIPPRSLYFSTFLSYLDGINPPNGIEIYDTVRKTMSISFYNYGLLDFCQISQDYSTGATADQFIFSVKDRNRYIMPKEANKHQWRSANQYCYSIQVPASTPLAAKKSIIQEDLVRWLGIMGIQVTRERRVINGTEKPVYIITEQ